MGIGYVINCNECDYSKEFMIGIGMMHSPHRLLDFNSEYALLPCIIESKKIISYIEYLLSEKNASISSGYGYEIYRCSKCNEFYSEFFLQLDYEEGNYEVEYKCKECNILLNRIAYNVQGSFGRSTKQINLKNYPCPKCSKYSLYEDKRYGFLWD